MNFNATDNRVLELYSYACSSGEQNAAISYIIVHLTYIRGLIHGIGRGVPNETKLDNSFPDAQFKVDSYTMYRKDGDGLLLFIRSDITTRQRADFETSEIESICIELNLGKTKWLIMGAYKSPLMKPDTFISDLQKSLDKMYINFENFILTW